MLLLVPGSGWAQTALSTGAAIGATVLQSQLAPKSVGSLAAQKVDTKALMACLPASIGAKKATPKTSAGSAKISDADCNGATVVNPDISAMSCTQLESGAGAKAKLSDEYIKQSIESAKTVAKTLACRASKFGDLEKMTSCLNVQAAAIKASLDKSETEINAYLASQKTQVQTSQANLGKVDQQVASFASDLGVDFVNDPNKPISPTQLNQMIQQSEMVQTTERLKSLLGASTAAPAPGASGAEIDPNASTIQAIVNQTASRQQNFIAITNSMKGAYVKDCLDKLQFTTPSKATRATGVGTVGLADFLGMAVGNSAGLSQNTAGVSTFSGDAGLGSRDGKAAAAAVKGQLTSILNGSLPVVAPPVSGTPNATSPTGAGSLLYSVDLQADLLKQGSALQGYKFFDRTQGRWVTASEVFTTSVTKCFSQATTTVQPQIKDMKAKDQTALDQTIQRMDSSWKDIAGRFLQRSGTTSGSISLADQVGAANMAKCKTAASDGSISSDQVSCLRQIQTGFQNLLNGTSNVIPPYKNSLAGSFAGQTDIICKNMQDCTTQLSQNLRNLVQGSTSARTDLKNMVSKTNSDVDNSLNSIKAALKPANTMLDQTLKQLQDGLRRSGLADFDIMSGIPRVTGTGFAKDPAMSDLYSTSDSLLASMGKGMIDFDKDPFTAVAKKVSDAEAKVNTDLETNGKKLTSISNKLDECTRQLATDLKSKLDLAAIRKCSYQKRYCDGSKSVLSDDLMDAVKQLGTLSDDVNSTSTLESGLTGLCTGDKSTLASNAETEYNKLMVASDGELSTCFIEDPDHAGQYIDKPGANPNHCPHRYAQLKNTAKWLKDVMDGKNVARPGDAIVDLSSVGETASLTDCSATENAFAQVTQATKVLGTTSEDLKSKIQQ